MRLSAAPIFTSSRDMAADVKRKGGTNTGHAAATGEVNMGV